MMLNNLANKLTLSRIIVIPLIVLVYYLPFSWSSVAASCLFVLGCFTDWLDGFIARKFKQTSNLGVLLDPIADKLIVATCLILLIDKYQGKGLESLAISLPAMLIIGREIAISGLREWLAKVQKSEGLAVSLAGKIKTLLQMVAVSVLLAGPVLPYWQWIGYTTLYAAVLLTLYSMFRYLSSCLQPH